MDNDINDLLGGAPSLDDMLGPAPKRKRRKAAAGKHDKLKRPRTILPNGIFALRDAAEKVGTLGVECLIDHVKLKKSRNGQRVICDKKACFRAYRNAYRAEYDRG